jgi:hypothetical protein
MCLGIINGLNPAGQLSGTVGDAWRYCKILQPKSTSTVTIAATTDAAKGKLRTPSVGPTSSWMTCGYLFRVKRAMPNCSPAITLVISYA